MQHTNWILKFIKGDVEVQKIPIELESFCSFNAIQGTSSDYDNFQTHMLNNANNNWSKINQEKSLCAEAFGDENLAYNSCLYGAVKSIAIRKVHESYKSRQTNCTIMPFQDFKMGSTHDFIEITFTSKWFLKVDTKALEGTDLHNY